LLVIVTGIIGLVFRLTSGAADEGETFLKLLAAGKTGDAYERSAQGLKSQQSREAFAESVRTMGLTEYASVSWSSREIQAGQAALEGTVTTRAGGVLPLSMALVQEAKPKRWRVFSLEVPRAGAVTAAGAREIPSDEALRDLVRQTLLAFNDAVRAKDFADFHAGISTLWKEQITPEKFSEIFSTFLEKQIDLSSIAKLQPVFDDPPVVNEQGLLVLKGYFATRPSKVRFTVKYTYEHPAWRLFGINVNVGE
jgi:hypothetical protein